MHAYICMHIQCIGVGSKAQLLGLILSCHYVSFRDHMQAFVVCSKYLYPINSVGSS